MVVVVVGVIYYPTPVPSSRLGFPNPQGSLIIVLLVPSPSLGVPIGGGQTFCVTLVPTPTTTPTPYSSLCVVVEHMCCSPTTITPHSHPHRRTACKADTPLSSTHPTKFLPLPASTRHDSSTCVAGYGLVAFPPPSQAGICYSPNMYSSPYSQVPDLTLVGISSPLGWEEEGWGKGGQEKEAVCVCLSYCQAWVVCGWWRPKPFHAFPGC